MSLLKKISSFGGREAIYDTKRSLSYAQLYRASWALASQMTVKFRQAKKWPVENPRILYMTNRDVLHPMAQFATWHLDGIAVPISSSSTTDEIEFFAKNSQADMIIAHKDFKKKLEVVKTGLDDIPIYQLDDSDVTLMTKSLLSRHLLKPMPANQDAMIVHTSGTTGTPKGVVHTHGSLEAMMV